MSAAGIFQSNLGTDVQQNYAQRSNRTLFEEALGQRVHDELDLYQHTQSISLKDALDALGIGNAAQKSVA